MKVKTSITLDPETLRAIDRAAGRRTTRSRLIEEAVLEYLARRARAARDARDRQLIDEHADALNTEMEDVLAYQEEL